MAHVYELKKVKEFLRNKSPLYLGKNFVLKETNPADFVKNFLLSYNCQFHTHYKKNNQLQCYRASSRTIGDIFRITYYYFPNVTIPTVYKVISELLSSYRINTIICNTVRKRVYNKGSAYYEFVGAHKDEYGIDLNLMLNFNNFKSEYSHDSSYLTQFKIK